MATRRSPFSPANSSASSPSTNTGVDPKKCTPTTGTPAFTARTRSASEGIGICVSLTLGDAAFKALTNSVFRKITSDDDDTTIAFFIRAPRSLVVAVENHVHALKHEALGIVLERKDSLAPQNVRAVLRDEILNPRKELVGIERLVGLQRNRLHLLVMVVLQAIAMMMVVMMIMAVFVMMVMIVVAIIGVEERRLNLENTIEIEGIAAEDFADVDLGAFGAMQPRVRIEPADPRLEFDQFVRRHQVGLVDQDDIGEGDLVLCFRCVLETIRQPLGVCDRYDRVQLEPRTDSLVREECMCDRRRICKPGRLHDDFGDFSFSPHQSVDDPLDVASHGAADTPIVHLEHFFVGVDHQLVVDADLAELVDDDGEFLAVRLGQNAVEQRGLAGAEVAGQHGNRDFLGITGGWH